MKFHTLAISFLFAGTLVISNRNIGASQNIATANPDVAVMTGTVHDLEDGYAIPNATIVLSTAINRSNHLPLGAWTTRTNRFGQFTIRRPTYRSIYIEIHEPLHITYHNIVSVSPKLSDIRLSSPTAEEQAMFNQLNVDREPYAPPLVLDETLVESARSWANYMALNAYFAHVAPANENSALQNPGSRYHYLGGNLGSPGENIASISQRETTAHWKRAELLYMNERKDCPNRNPIGCLYSEATGHFLNIVNTQSHFVGVGAAYSSHAQQAFNSTKEISDYFDQEFL